MKEYFGITGNCKVSREKSGIRNSGTNYNELNDNTSMTTIQRNQATNSTYDRKHMVSIAMLCEKKMNSEIENATTNLRKQGT
ncbi:hypothetical protein MKW98_012089 [Papaver atlanticum]|uniref:Uncharacterized protein n=1 Tax=Papaver atlanticum TaxID=357466 RepID=A0AAD4TEJ1_9MAGN|nr:hypothetical protein MKW98_012089 [Papaver atlanticum]